MERNVNKGEGVEIYLNIHTKDRALRYIFVYQTFPCNIVIAFISSTVLAFKRSGCLVISLSRFFFQLLSKQCLVLILMIFPCGSGLPHFMQARP